MTIPTGAEVFRDYEILGVPASESNKVSKREARALFSHYESLLNGSAAGLAYATLSAINADLAQAPNSLAIVYGDTTPAHNGQYVKIGASGTGSWSRIGDLSNGLVRLTVTGGTGNAIIATATETPTVPGNKLYLLTPSATNTAATTITVNGGAAIDIKNSLGAQLASNSLLNNSPVIMQWSVDHYQIIESVPVDATGVLNDALDAASDAAASALAASSSAAALGNQVHQYDTRGQAAAATIPVGVQAIKITRHSSGCPLAYATYIPGTVAGPMAFQEAGGHYWELDLSGGIVKAAWFGAKTATDSTTAFQACLDAVRAAGGRLIEVEPGTYIITSQLTYITTSSDVFTPGLKMVGAGKETTFFDNRVAGTSLTHAFTATIGSVIFGVAWPSHGKVAGDIITLRNCSRSATVTITLASPAVVTCANHGITLNGDVVLSTTGTLPTGLAPGRYYARNVTTNTMELALLPGGASINTSGSQSGTHTGTTNLIGGRCLDGAWAVASVPDANSLTFNHMFAAASTVAVPIGSALATKAMLKVGTSAALKFQLGGILKDFSIKTTTSPIASSGVEMRSAYRYQCDFNVKGMSGDGVCLPCVNGDSDGGNQNEFDGRIENCGCWGFIVDNPAHNEVSGTTLGDMLIQSCGTASLFTIPPSGGAKWKGQGLHFEKAFFTVNYNTSVYLTGGPNGSNSVTFNFLVLENTIAPVGAAWYIEGAVGVVGNIFQIYQADAFKARYGVRVSALLDAVLDVDMALCVLRVTSGNNPHGAFSVLGANAGNVNARAVRQLLYGGDGQTLYETWPVA